MVCFMCLRWRPVIPSVLTLCIPVSGPVIRGSANIPDISIRRKHERRSGVQSESELQKQEQTQGVHELTFGELHNSIKRFYVCPMTFLWGLLSLRVVVQAIRVTALRGSCPTGVTIRAG